MKHLAMILFAIISSTSLAQKYESQYKVGDDVFTLNLSIKEITTYYGQEKLLNYSVHMNGKFLHPKYHRGGRLISHSETRKCRVHVLNKKGKGFGWLLEAHAIDGNTHSYKYCLVVPNTKRFGRPAYISEIFEAKSFPLIQFDEENVSFWYYEQNWGEGGTASSIYVPRKLVVKETGYHSLGIEKGNVLQGIEIFEHTENGDYSTNLV
jgi:hypothetical protein